MNGIDAFLSNEFTEKTDLFEVEWSNVDLSLLRKNILAVIAFDETKISLKKIV